MAKQPAPRLEGGLIVRKGEASPSITTPPVSVSPLAASVPAASESPTPARAPLPRGIAGTIAVTVRLDPERYERLKVHGARHRRTNQEIIVAALDAYLARAE